MKSKRLVLGSWAIYFILLLSLYFVEMIFMNKDFAVRYMEITHLVPFFISILAFTIWFFYYEKKHNKENLNFIFAGIISALFIMFTVVILVLPESKEFTLLNDVGGRTPSSPTFIFNLTIEDKLYYIFMTFISCLMSYLYIVVLPKKYYFTRIINIAYYLALTFMAVVIIYSYIAEWEIYIHFFNDFIAKGVTGFPVPRSFFLNRNNLGFVYLAMICFTLLVHHQHPKWWYYVIATYLLLNSLPCLSKTNFALSVFIMLAYFVGRFFATFKEHKKRNIIAGSIITVIVVVITVFSIISFYLRNEFFEFIKRVIVTTFNFNDSHFSTFTGRTYLWEMVIDILNQTSWVVGAGHGVFNNLLLEYCKNYWGEGATTMPHNGFMQLLGEGGIIYLVAFFAFIGYVVYNLIKIQKAHKGLAVFEWPMLVTILAHMLFESATPAVFAIPTVDSMIFVLLFALPVLNTRYKDTHKEVLEDIVVESEVVKYRNLRENPFAKANSVLFFLTPLLAIVLGTFYAFFGFNVPLWYIVLMLGALFIYIFIPYLFNTHEHFKDYIKNSLGKSLLVALGLSLYFFLFTLWSKDDKSALLFIGFSGGMLYISMLTYIPKLNDLGEFLFVVLDNFNTLLIRAYSPFIKRELEHRKTQKAALSN